MLFGNAGDIFSISGNSAFGMKRSRYDTPKKEGLAANTATFRHTSHRLFALKCRKWSRFFAREGRPKPTGTGGLAAAEVPARGQEFVRAFGRRIGARVMSAASVRVRAGDERGGTAAGADSRAIGTWRPWRGVRFADRLLGVKIEPLTVDG